jgi:predicted RNase H-like HicB family nuclease
LVEEIVKTYHVTYERDESGWWVASVRGLRGCHTQGRTVDEARRRIVEAMELFVDSVRVAKIVDDVKLPAAAKKAIRAYTTLRRKAEQEDRRASVAARRAVRVLRGGRLKMSARDAARVLGLSHQRVHQLAHEKRTSG